MSEQNNATTCPLCSRTVTRTPVDGFDALSYDCPYCGKFIIDGPNTASHVNSDNRTDKPDLSKVSFILHERRVGMGEKVRYPTPFLRFGEDPSPKPIDGTVVVRVQDILNEYPQTFAELVERSFLALLRSNEQKCLQGGELSIERNAYADHLLFATNWDQALYFLDTMEQHRWLETVRTGGFDSRDVRIAPEGWQFFDEITRTKGSANNPVFVAMWFGRGRDGQLDRTEEMSNLFDRTIKRACEWAGWKVIRAGIDEHNEPIMDRIVADIRAAPFLIAELTENNQGVYYEAGFAKGLGKEVIYCCPEGKRVHFDLSGVNHVRWKDANDLRKRVGNRILGTMGRGPHKFDRE